MTHCVRVDPNGVHVDSDEKYAFLCADCGHFDFLGRSVGIQMNLKIHWHGLSCCEVQIDRPMNPLLFRRLDRAARVIREDGVAEGALSSYSAVAGYWNRPVINQAKAEDAILSIIQKSLAVDRETFGEATVHKIQVDYSGPDLEDVSQYTGLAPSEIIERHSACRYTVAAVGFMPNFAYLWGLDSKIATPRRKSPRVRVPIGSVGIGGSQTGIYPRESPGGWQLIGSIDPTLCEQVCPKFCVGDEVVFVDRNHHSKQ